MTINIAFWVVYIVALLLSAFINRTSDRFGNWAGSGLIFFVLIGILAYATLPK